MQFSEIPYKRPDFDKIRSQYIDQISRFSAAQTVEEQSLALQAIEDVRAEFQTYSSVASVRNTIDVSNSFYDAEQQYYDQHEPLFDALNMQYFKALTASSFQEPLRKKYGNQLFDLASVRLKSFDEKIIDDLKEENRLTTEYVKLLASAAIDFEGKKRNLAGLDPFEQSPDRSLRERAVKARYDFLFTQKEKLDDIFDQLVKVRHTIAQKLGYNHFVELGYNRMMRTDYNATQVADFRNLVVRHIVPLSLSLKERQKNRLGIDSFAFWDNAFQFESGNPTPKGDPDWILQMGKEMYAELSQQTNTFFQFMVDHGLMDLVNKDNKAAGGYCTYFPKFKSPFIFSNFNGTSHDVDVLTHEAGHAFQVYESRHFDISEYHFPTYEACEIHSMSMEFFTWPWMQKFFQQDTEKYKFLHLGGGVNFLPYGCQVDEFQHIIYENPSLTPTQRNEVWKDLDKKYRPYLNYSGIPFLEQGGAWQRQAHIYKSPFYYIDYCLAQICAFQFWQKSQADFSNAWQDYLRLCQAGGSQSFLKLVTLAGLESPFSEKAFTSAIKPIADWLTKVDDRAL